MVDPDRALAELLDLVDVVADEKQRRTAGKHLLHAVVAFLLEHEVTHRQNFVAGQDVGPHLGGDGEAQAGDHAGRVVFHRHIDKIPQFGKVDDVFEVLVHIGTVMPQDGAVEVNVLAGGQLDFAIRHYWSHLDDEEDKYRLWFTDVVARTASLIAQWQTVGFAHGVMNTDNMSLLGLTLDYGPFGFLDDYEPGFICNHSDHQGRYSFDNQPAVALWNLQRLAQTLSPFVAVDALNEALDSYQQVLLTHYGQRMRQKLGFMTEQKEDNALLNELFSLMARERSDYTRTFRMLSLTEQHSAASPLRDEFIDRAAFDDWFARYRGRLQQDEITDSERQQLMQSVNPALVLRNWLAQRAIEAAEKDDMTELHRLHEALRNPFSDRDDDYVSRPPDWGKRLEVSCSS